MNLKCVKLLSDLNNLDRRALVKTLAIYMDKGSRVVFLEICCLPSIVNQSV